MCVSIGGVNRAIAVQTNIGDEAQVEALFSAAEQAFGTVTLLVNSAGLNMTGVNLVDMELAQFDRVMRSDLYGPFLTCRRMVRALERKVLKGRVVNISSIYEKAPRPAASTMMPPKAACRSSPRRWRWNSRQRGSRSTASRQA